MEAGPDVRDSVEIFTTWMEGEDGGRRYERSCIIGYGGRRYEWREAYV